MKSADLVSMARISSIYAGNDAPMPHSRQAPSHTKPGKTTISGMRSATQAIASIMILAVVTTAASNLPIVGVSPGTGATRIDVPGDTSSKTGEAVPGATSRQSLGELISSRVTYTLASARHRDVAKTAEQIVAAMTAAALGSGVRDIPPMVASEDADGTIYVEWIFSDRRVGLTFDRDTTQSGWHYVVDRGGEPRLIRGRLDELEPAALAKLALVSS